MIINEETCNECDLCIEACQLGAISYIEGKLVISEECSNSLGCTARLICPQGAIERVEQVLPEEVVVCPHCPLACQVKPNKMGDCAKFINRDGVIVRAAGVTPYEEVKDIVGEECDPVIQRPLLTGIGAGSGLLSGAAPYIVQDKVNGVDVVTCVTEAHLSFSGIKVKIDAEKYIGEEGAEIFHKGTKVGIVTPEEYGSKTIYIGGINTFTGKNGWIAAKMVADIANRERVELRVRGGAKLEIQVGEKPVINGERCERRRFGCGAETSPVLFRGYLREFFKKGIIDEGIVIDRQIIGRAGRRLEGEHFLSFRLKSGLQIRGQTPWGWYFPHYGGDGWGMTTAKEPLEIIEDIDPARLEPSFTLFITEANGDRYGLYEWTKEGKFKEIEVPAEIKKAMDEFRADCEPAMVSAYYMGGAGGGARRMVTKRPLRLNEAFKDRKAFLTVGGAPAFIFMGGGVNFMVNVERVKTGSFHWSAVPGTVAPIEFTMKLKDFDEIGGHVERIRPLKEVLEELKKRQG